MPIQCAIIYIAIDFLTFCISGPSGLKGRPGVPGPPGPRSIENFPGPTGDAGLPGLDGQNGKYISLINFDHLLSILCFFHTFSCFPLHSPILFYAYFFFLFPLTLIYSTFLELNFSLPLLFSFLQVSEVLQVFLAHLVQAQLRETEVTLVCQASQGPLVQRANQDYLESLDSLADLV